MGLRRVVRHARGRSSVLSAFGMLAFFAQLTAIIVTIFYGGELARKNVGRRFALSPSP